MTDLADLIWGKPPKTKKKKAKEVLQQVRQVPIPDLTPLIAMQAQLLVIQQLRTLLK